MEKYFSRLSGDITLADYYRKYKDIMVLKPPQEFLARWLNAEKEKDEDLLDKLSDEFKNLSTEEQFVVEDLIYTHLTQG
jgi:hypothetical protein